MARNFKFTRNNSNAVALLHECNIKSFHFANTYVHVYRLVFIARYVSSSSGC